MLASSVVRSQFNFSGFILLNFIIIFFGIGAPGTFTRFYRLESSFMLDSINNLCEANLININKFFYINYLLNNFLY